MKGWGLKGQVTLFVILGIFILGLIGLGIYLKVVPQGAQLREEVTEVIPGEFQPVKRFVEQCVYDIGKEALVKAGEHGGHVDPVRYAGVVVIPDVPTQSTGIELAPGSGVILPYWFYLRSPDRCQSSCVFDSKRPPLSRLQGENSVESQVDDYIEENLPLCLDRFKPFKDQFIIKELEKPEVTTTITERGVSFFLKFPVDVTRDQLRQRITQYQAELPLNFKELYDIASVLLEAVEAPHMRFFERLSLTVIGTFSLGRNPVIPPMEGGTRLGLGSPKVWEKRKVKGEVESLLADNIPIVDVMGSLNNEIVLKENNPMFNGIYNNYHLTLDTIPPVDLSSKIIEFDYLDWWPIYLDMPQAKGEIIMPDSVINTFLVPIGIQRFDFTYDYSFPVTVRIQDIDSLRGEGFTFQYAFEVNVRNNRAMESDVGGLGAQGSLFCDHDKRNSGNFTIQTRSTKGGSLKDIGIGYSCAGESCFIGRTDENGILKTQLPICMDGTLSASNENFFGPGVRLSTALGQGGSTTLTLEEVRVLEARAMRLPVRRMPFEFDEGEWNEGIGWELLQTPVPLRKDEEAVVVLERVQGLADDPFIEVLRFSGDEVKELKLTSGKYNYQAYMFVMFGPDSSVEKIMIQNRTICGGGVLGIGDQCMEIPSMEMAESFVEGSFTLDGLTSGPIEVSSGNVGSGKVLFGLPGVNLEDINYHEDILVIQAIENMSRTNRAALLPRFG